MQPDPTFLEALLTGKYIPAVGLALIAFVAVARGGLTWLSPWFATKPGGYLVGFTSAFALYVGAALRDGAGLTVGLFTAALGIGWAASGGFEMVRDLLEYMRRKAPTRPTLVLLVLQVALGGFGCKVTRPYLPPVTHPIVDCAAASLADALVVSWFTRRPSWSQIRNEAIDAGIEIGGCAFAAYLQRYLAPAPGNAAPPPEDAIAAKDAFEQYRNVHALNATFRFRDGDL